MVDLILTSDDFGLSYNFNEEILERIQNNNLTSTSIMVNKIDMRQSNQLNRLAQLNDTIDISLGLHLEISTLNEIEPVANQWHKFIDIFKFCPDYIDIHKASSLKGDFDNIARFCIENDVAFRKYRQTSINVKSPSTSTTLTYIEIDKINHLISKFEHGTFNELIFHIGVFDRSVKSSLNAERALDIEKLNFIHKNLDKSNYRLANFKHLK